MRHSLLAAALAASLTLLLPIPAVAAPRVTANHAHIALTPAVTSGGVFSDARDTALAALRFSPAVSRGGVFSDPRDTALSRMMYPTD